MKKKTNEVEVGIFVILGFIFLTLVLFFVSGVYLFRSGYTVDVLYEYVSILNKGAPVRMGGVRIGEVNKVQLFYDESKQKTRVRVKLFIEKGAEIRENYVFTIRGTHILSEPHVEITPKPGNFPLLHRGSTVEGVSPLPVEELIGQIHEISGQIRDSSISVNTILSKVRDGEGTVGGLLMKDDIYKDMEALVKDVRAHPWKLLKKDSTNRRKWYFLYLF